MLTEKQKLVICGYLESAFQLDNGEDTDPRYWMDGEHTETAKKRLADAFEVSEEMLVDVFQEHLAEIFMG